MSVSLLIRATASIAAALVATAAAAVEAPNPKDLTQGVWELNLAKSKFCKPQPRSGRREIVDVGWGLIGVHWTGVDADGKPIDVRYVWRYDGEKYPATIMEPAKEAISWKLVNPSRVEFVHWSKDNKKTEELVRTVTPDGQEMTQTRSYLGGAECVDVQVFKRVARPKSAT
jgi:hypothetical protein